MTRHARIVSGIIALVTVVLVACERSVFSAGGSETRVVQVEAAFAQSGPGIGFMQAMSEEFPQTVQTGTAARFGLAPTGPRLDAGGRFWGIIWLSSDKYAVVYGPHDGKLGPSVKYGRHMNFDVYYTNKPFRNRDNGGRVTELANFHTAWLDHNGKKCLYVYDNVSGGEKWACPPKPPKSTSEKFRYAREAVQAFFLAYLGIHVAAWVAEIIAGIVLTLMTI